MSLKINNNDYKGFGLFDKGKAGGSTLNEQQAQTILLNNLASEVQKLTDNNSDSHYLIDGTTSTFTNFKSLTYTVFDGTAIIVTNGASITFPLQGSNASILGETYTSEALSSSTIIINATNGKVLVNLIS